MKNLKRPLFTFPFAILILLILTTTINIHAACRGTHDSESSVPESASAETKIVILHLNDIHAKIDNLAKIAWLIQKERNENSNVFLLNAGDIFSGNPIVDQYEPKGEPIMALLMKLGFDVHQIGNHEFDYGQQSLADYIKRANFPFLCANIQIIQSPLQPFQPFTILKTKNGIKIAVLGLLEVGKDNMLPSSHPMKLEGLKFSDGIETAKKYAYLRDENEVFIALTHLGVEEDEVLAKEMGGLDLIVGGHSHTTIQNPVVVNNIMITQAGSYAMYLGKIELIVKNGKVISKTARLIDVNSCKNEIPEIKEMIVKYNNNPLMDRIVATLPREINGRTEMANLITDAIRFVHKVDIAFHNGGGIRSDYLEKKVPIKSIYKILPFGNDIVQYQMTADQIIQFIRTDLTRHKRRDLQVSGLKYTVVFDGNKKIIDLTVTDEKGNPLNPKKNYTVAMNDYMASTYKFEPADSGRALQTSIAQTLIDYLSGFKLNFNKIDRERTFEKEEKK